VELVLYLQVVAISLSLAIHFHPYLQDGLLLSLKSILPNLKVLLPFDHQTNLFQLL
jgi:flagellar biosynthesis protein FlhB